MKNKRETDSFKQQRTVERALQQSVQMGTTLSSVGGGERASELSSIDEGLPGVADDGVGDGEWLCGDPVGSKPV